MKRCAVIAAAAMVLIAGCAQSPNSTTASTTSAGNQAALMTCDYASAGSPARAVDPPDGRNVATTGTVTITMQLDQGSIVLNLDRSAAPCAVHSVESLAAQGFYSNTDCHRLTTQGIYILQCGDPSGTGDGGPGYSLPDELSSAQALCTNGEQSCIYPKGTIAMAAPNTNGSQFFMVYSDSMMAPDYPVIGTLDDAGVQVIADIAASSSSSTSGSPSASSSASGTPGASPSASSSGSTPPTRIHQVISG